MVQQQLLLVTVIEVSQIDHQ